MQDLKLTDYITVMVHHVQLQLDTKTWEVFLHTQTSDGASPPHLQINEYKVSVSDEYIQDNLRLESATTEENASQFALALFKKRFEEENNLPSEKALMQTSEGLRLIK